VRIQSKSRKRLNRLLYWHKWFAWYPVCIKEIATTDDTWVWLEVVFRRCDFPEGWQVNQYKLLDGSNPPAGQNPP